MAEKEKTEDQAFLDFAISSLLYTGFYETEDESKTTKLATELVKMKRSYVLIFNKHKNKYTFTQVYF